MILSVKQGVRFDRDSLAMSRMLSTLLLLPPLTTSEAETIISLLITSATDGSHTANSRHYKAEALDIRVRMANGDLWLSSTREEVRAYIETALGRKFRVLDEGDHLHVQVRKGQTYP